MLKLAAVPLGRMRQAPLTPGERLGGCTGGALGCPREGWDD
jgi:hypothetical protein